MELYVIIGILVILQIAVLIVLASLKSVLSDLKSILQELKKLLEGGREDPPPTEPTGSGEKPNTGGIRNR
ncbi:MAG: hypothetical protein ACRBF0_15245 [Calditrichia bacterium]